MNLIKYVTLCNWNEIRILDVLLKPVFWHLMIFMISKIGKNNPPRTPLVFMHNVRLVSRILLSIKK